MEGKNYILLEEMGVYNLQTGLSDEIWNIAIKWNFFAKDTIGKQLTRAFDSIGANIAEGFGRFHYADKVKFYYYSRGSVFESQYWIKRARERNLIKQEDCLKYLQSLQQINKELNFLIKGCKNKKSQSQSQS
jgi:four helix bundle protein